MASILARRDGTDPASHLAPLRVGPTLRVTVVLTSFAVLVAGAVVAARALGTDPARPDIMDFDVFHLVGRLAWQGRLPDAYTRATMGDIERTLGGGRDIYMPYAYPPFFAIVAAVLALLPAGAASVAFSTAGLLSFLGVMRWLGGPWAWAAIMATAPAMFINLLVGQNGLLTASLAGLAAELALAGRGGSAGLTAGTLAALKPQTCAALPLLFLMRRDWRALAVLAATAIALSGLALVIVGPATAPAVLAGMSEAGRFMTAGRFPLHRLVSVYACALGLGAPAWLAMSLHAAVAVTVLVATTFVERRLADHRAAAGITLMATVFVSPYLYDYDLTILGVGLALALPGLARGRCPGRIGPLLFSVALIEAVGMAQAMSLKTGLSLGGPALVAWFAAVLAAVVPQTETSPAPYPAGRREAAAGVGGRVS